MLAFFEVMNRSPSSEDLSLARRRIGKKDGQGLGLNQEQSNFCFSEVGVRPIMGGKHPSYAEVVHSEVSDSAKEIGTLAQTVGSWGFDLFLVAQSVENEEVREAVNYYELEKYLPLGLMGKKILLKVQEEQLPFDPLGKNHRLIARGSKFFLFRAKYDEEGDVSVKVGRGNTRKEFENLQALICNFGQITKKLDWAFGLAIKGLGLKHSGPNPWLGLKRKMGIQKKWADCLKGCGLGQISSIPI